MYLTENEINTPFIHRFTTSEGYYWYDVNTDKILRVPEEVYHYQFDDENTTHDTRVTQYIEGLKSEGYLKNCRVKEIEHPATEFLPYYIKHKISYVTLQVTQNCNFRCSYCAYSGKYHNRSHSIKQMSKETAEKAIQYYVNHARDNKRLAIGFYGGEPLLCFDLIKYCVDFADQYAEGRQIKYSMTTNGTLLTEEIIRFLVEHDFKLTISLDGPAEIHDAQRRFAMNNKGSHEIIIKNILYIKKNYPDFYKKNVYYNTVLDPTKDFNCVHNYIMNSEEFETSHFSYSLIDNRYSKQETYAVDEDFIAAKEYELFKFFLKKLNRLDSYRESKLIVNDFGDIEQTRAGKEASLVESLPEKGHRGGQCIPGVMRLFVDADGYLFPCERVSEVSEAARIGHIDSGIDLDKAVQLLNIERATGNMCRNCWAYRYCKICIREADDLKDISPTVIAKRCPSVRRQVEELFKDYCVLKELGYNFKTEEDYIFEDANS